MPKKYLTMYDINQLTGSRENREKIIKQYPNNPAVRFFIALHMQKKPIVQIADAINVIVPYHRSLVEFYNDIQEGLFEQDEKKILARELGTTAAAIWGKEATDEHGQSRTIFLSDPSRSSRLKKE